jgi:hypothetical protein
MSVYVFSRVRRSFPTGPSVALKNIDRRTPEVDHHLAKSRGKCEDASGLLGIEI